MEVARKHFGPLLDARQLASFLSRIASASEQFGPQGQKCMDQERFLALMRQEREAVMERLAMVRSLVLFPRDTKHCVCKSALAVSPHQLHVSPCRRCGACLLRGT